ncbi:hypothetical protein Tco_0566027 [Tanacetum coccineum]
METAGFGSYWAESGSSPIPLLGGVRYLRLFTSGRKQGAMIFGRQFVTCLAEHFRLLTEENLQGLTAWVAPGPEKQPDDAAGAPKVAKDAPAVDEGASANPAPMQVPQPPHAAPKTMPQRIARLEEEVHELHQSIVGLRGDIDRSITDQSRFATWMVNCTTQLMDAKNRTYQAFDNTLVVIMEYLVKIRKKALILELKQRNMKITVLKSYTPYPSRKIRHIYACTSPNTTREQESIRLIMEYLVKISKKTRILELKRRHLKITVLTSYTPFLALGWLLEGIHVTWAHLEKKQTRLQLYTKSLKKLCIQSLETESRVSSDGVRMFEVTATEIIYTKIDINQAGGGNLRRLIAEEAWETIEDYAQCDKQWKNPTSTISDQTIANLKAQLVENEVVRVMIPKCMSWLDAYDEPIVNFAEITNGNLHAGIFEEKKKFFFTDPGEGVRINPDGVARSATGKFDF